MTGAPRVVLLACGSFNPPTNMHLRMFEIARDFLHRTTHFSVVAGLLSPVHDKYGKEGLASANERIQMLQLAVASNPWIHVSEFETQQDDWLPTREVLQYHKDSIDSFVNGNLDPSVKRQRLDGVTTWMNHLEGSSESVNLKLLCGADLLESFGRPGLWKEEDIESIVGKFGLVVITREGSNPYKFIYESDILTKHQKNIHIVTEWITNEVSSTKVRRALRRGESIKYLVQDQVIDFIYKHSLFNTHNKFSRDRVLLHTDIDEASVGSYRLWQTQEWEPGGTSATTGVSASTCVTQVDVHRKSTKPRTTTVPRDPTRPFQTATQIYQTSHTSKTPETVCPRDNSTTKPDTLKEHTQRYGKSQDGVVGTSSYIQGLNILA